MLNASFASPHLQPDLSATFLCSPVTYATRFTYLMALVMSGRNAVTGKLSRHAELETFLATPEAADACRQTNSKGWTALMLAARNSRTDSTEDVVTLLLSHESSGQVARMQDSSGWTALTLAVRSSASESTEETVAILLDHASSGDVARMLRRGGVTALSLAACNSRDGSSDATVAMLLAHESSVQVMRIKSHHGISVLESAAINAEENGSSAEETVAMLCPYVDDADFERISFRYPSAFRTYLLTLRQRTQERATLSLALRQGLSLVEATTLLYI
jgi:ankyrin repeat protein